jgi:hypothetical protein
VRIDADPALTAPPGEHLVDTVASHRRPVVHPQPELRPVRLPIPGADPDLAVKTADGLIAEPDDPRLAALAADGDLALRQVNVAALRVVWIVMDTGVPRWSSGHTTLAKAVHPA